MKTGAAARRGFAAVLVACLVVLTGPRGVWARASAPGHACGTTTAACCCGVAGGCRMCPTEQATPAQRVAAETLRRGMACSGPSQTAAVHGERPAYVVPAVATARPRVVPTGRVRLAAWPNPPSVPRVPDVPPPRSRLTLTA